MDKHRHIGFELRLVHNLLGEAIRQKREEDGVCMTQLQHLIIRFLLENQHRDVYQKDLEEVLCTSRATISSTLQVMERNGLVERRMDASDARCKKLLLTEKAKDFYRKARANVEEMEALLRKDISAEEAELLMELLQRIRNRLEEYLRQKKAE